MIRYLQLHLQDQTLNRIILIKKIPTRIIPNMFDIDDDRNVTNQGDPNYLHLARQYRNL